MADAEYLDASGLARLCDAWEIWAREPGTTPRRISRMRSHFIFLLIRFGGLRLGEALQFQIERDLDCQTGLIHVQGKYARKLILPVPPMRLFREIATLEEAKMPEFLNLDPGFCRKTFYNVAETAAIPCVYAGPRALRQARAMELAALHVPLNLIQQYLGIDKTFL